MIEKGYDSTLQRGDQGLFLIPVGRTPKMVLNYRKPESVSRLEKNHLNNKSRLIMEPIIQRKSEGTGEVSPFLGYF